MKKNNTAKRVSSTTRANGLYSLELRKIGPKFSISQDKKKQRAKNQCRQKGSKNEPFYYKKRDQGLLYCLAELNFFIAHALILITCFK